MLPGFTKTDLGRGIGVNMNAIGDKITRKWMLSEQVVKALLHDLKKQNRVICVLGAMNKVTYTIAKMMPERLWYMIEPSIKRSMP